MKRSLAQRRSFSISDDNDAMFRKNQIDYYNRLIYQCRKDLNKHTKITKKFEIQKQIRKIKDCSNHKDTSELVVAKQEKKLQQLKEYCTEPIIDECLRRIGIKQLDPKLQFSSSAEANGKKSDSNESLGLDDSIVGFSTDPSSAFDSGNKKNDSVASNVSFDVQVSALNAVRDNEIVDNEWILHRIMKHKAIISALDHWNGEVTEYRRWSLRQRERIDGENSEIYGPSHKKDRQSLKSGASDASINGSSLFVALGSNDISGSAPGKDSGLDPCSYYGPGSGDDGTMRKNRQGQRGRRAKAAAIEAKKHGRILRPEESLNWRSPKAQPEQRRELNRTAQRATAPQRLNAGNDQSMSSTKFTTTIAVEELHPSWQARKGQKEGIVAFQGKKTTFDDE
jgi:hypothetical protein